MPTYEYECKECGKIFERFESIKSRPKRVLATDCERCNNRAPVTRLIGAGAGVIFKGSGFYETDYRSEGYKKAAKADSEETKGKSETDGGKSKESSTGSQSDGGGSDGPKKSSTSPESKKSDG